MNIMLKRQIPTLFDSKEQIMELFLSILFSAALMIFIILVKFAVNRIMIKNVGTADKKDRTDAEITTLKRQ